MKISILKHIILFLLIVSITGCSRVEENLFDTPSSLRLEKSREGYQQTLEAAPQGWLLQYYPHPDQEIGGINYYLTFKDGIVTAETEGSSQSESSHYEVLNRGGNILSFNLYNPLLHLYANPSSTSYNGKQGDFEFLILNKEGDNILNLKGLRTGNHMKLIKLGNNLDEYKKKEKNIRKYLSKLYFPIKGVVNGKEATLEYRGIRNAALNYKDGEEVKSLNFSYIYTDKGILFYNPITIDGKEYKELLFNENERKLVSEDGKIEIIDLKYVLVNFEITSWALDTKNINNRSDKIKAAWDGDNFLNGILLGGKYNLQSNYIIGNLDSKIGIFSYITEVSSKNTLSLGGYKLSFKPEFNSGEIISKTIHISKEKPYALDWYYKWINGINDVITQNSPYTMEADNEDDPTEVKLISKAKPEVWFILTK